MHGITANAHIFEPVMDLLSDTFRSPVSINAAMAAVAGAGYGGTILQPNRSLDRGIELRTAILLGTRSARVMPSLPPTAIPDMCDGIVAVDFTPFIEAEVWNTGKAE